MLNTLVIVLTCLPINGLPASTSGEVVSGSCTTLAGQPATIPLVNGTTMAECEQIIKSLSPPISRASPGLIASWGCGYSSKIELEEQYK